MIDYRKATINDCSLLAKIRVDFLVEANDVKDQDEKDLLHINNEKFLRDSLTDGSFAAWLAIEDGEIIATSGVSFYNLPPNKKCPTGKVAYIGNMFTYPQYRNKGIASKLFNLVVEECKNHGCEKILLNATDMGKPIYEKFGFKDVSNDMVYYII